MFSTFGQRGFGEKVLGSVLRRGCARQPGLRSLTKMVVDKMVGLLEVGEVTLRAWSARSEAEFLHWCPRSFYRSVSPSVPRK